MDRIQQFEHSLRPFGDINRQRTNHHLAERMLYYGVPAVSLAVIEDGKLAWARGYGARDGTASTPITPDTRFPVASITKPIVGLAVLRLVQQGVLDLDVDVNQYLTSWTLPDNRFTHQAKVTLRRLLSHSAGTTTYGFWGYRPSGSIPTLLQVLDGLPPANSVAVRVARLPGSRWSYSSGGYCIIQQVMMDVLRQPFPELMTELVLAPLQMRDSLFTVVPPPEYETIAAYGHDATGASLAERWRAHPELAAGGLWSTPTDMAKWAIAIQDTRAGANPGFLTQGLTRQMLTPQINNWGLGPAIDGMGATARFAHGGAKLGFRSYLVAYCERGQGAVITTNGERGDHLCVEILHSLARVYDWPEYYHYLDNPESQ
jgi:CubicO group peptidase (beta-lactamase class C family)